MKPIFLTFFLLALLSYQSYTYSLEGRWGVKSQYLPTDVNASITFEKQINTTNSRIVYYMNVFACRLMRYKYIVVDNEIYLTFDQFVTDRYTCKTNQISTIRNKLEKVFFFYIVGTELALYGANGDAQFQMSRIPILSPKNLSGLWLTVDVNGAVFSESISATENTFELCEGKGVIRYVISSISKPSVNFTVQKTSGCSQNEIFSTLNKVDYFRWKNSNLVYLYDQNFQQIMTIRKIGEMISADAPDTNSNQNDNKAVVNQDLNSVQTISVPSNPGSNTDTNRDQRPSENIVANRTNPITPTTNPVTPPVIQVKTPETNNPSSNPPIQQPQGTVAQNPAKTSNDIVTPTQQVIPKTVEPKNMYAQSVVQTTPVPTANPTRQYRNVADLPSITPEQFAGKWLIMDSQYSSATYKYFFLMVGNRITLYGDCQVHLSTFTLANSTLDGMSFRSITLVTNANQTPGFNCDESRQRISILIQKWKKWKYVVIESINGKVNLQLLDSSFAALKNLKRT